MSRNPSLVRNADAGGRFKHLPNAACESPKPLANADQSGSGVGNNSELWSWSDDVINGVQGITVNVPTAGIHTLNIWAREDGVEIDKVVLEIGGTIPSGFGPARSNLINPLMPPVVTAFLRDSQPGDQSVLLTRPDLLNALTFTFDQDINIDSDQLLIRNDSTSGTYRPFQGAFEYDSDTFTATWNVSPGDPSTPPLEPGFYTFSLNSANVSSVRSMQLLDGNGDGEEGDFFSRQVYVAIPGDANLDGSVDVLSDGFALVRNLGGTSGHTWGKGISMVTVPSMS